MLSSVFKYAYPHAKVRALKGKLLSEKQFRALLNVETFDEVLHILQTTNYADALSEQPSQDISIPVLTQITYKSLFDDYEKTIRSVKGNIQAFFILLYQKYELINLKTILRGICGHVDPSDVAPLLLPTGRYSLFSKDTLLEFRDVHEVVEHLQGTFFQYPLNRALHRFKEEQEFFPLEMALDLHYYQTLWDSTQKLPTQERQTTERVLGMFLDILNISWIIRFKEQYHFSPEEILNYTIHHGAAFTLRDRKRLAEAKGVGEVLDFLKSTPYKRALSGDVPLNTLHIVLERYFIAQARRLFSGNPFHIGVILGYLFLKEFEIADIITIAEAKKYGFSLEQSQSYVIHDVLRNM